MLGVEVDRGRGAFLAAQHFAQVHGLARRWRAVPADQDDGVAFLLEGDGRHQDASHRG
jgi:hypothetical protein